MEDYAVVIGRPKYYVLEYKKNVLVIVDLEGKTELSDLEKKVNEIVGSEFNKLRKKEKPFYPSLVYKTLSEGLKEYLEPKGVIVVDNPIRLEVNRDLLKAIKEYNRRIMQTF